MTTNELLDLANKLFYYENGSLRWKVQSAKRIKVGDLVGHAHPDGHIYVNFNNKLTGVHRIIFLMKYKYLPEEVDHIDNNGLNNNIDNLRAATKSQNQHNRKLNINNTSGVKGIFWKESKKLWVVRVQINNIRKYIGSFKDLELAELVAFEARDKYHGEFARNV